ncbi:hypothetical protein FAI40_07700 [Acetobacteraceae bacterium]|nr:hypothetical protein FAI40_07700 [Acetobacteraceae bacterium]
MNAKLLVTAALDCVGGMPHFKDYFSFLALGLLCLLLAGSYISFCRLKIQKVSFLDFKDYVLVLGAVICFLVVSTSAKFDDVDGVRYITATIVFISIFLARHFVFF